MSITSLRSLNKLVPFGGCTNLSFSLKPQGSINFCWSQSFKCFMDTRRVKSAPDLVCSPRGSLDAISHTSIDSVLKELKSSSRRLQTAFSVFRVELQVLERLYYKGKNQHRSALFWKRASEIKRYGERLDGMDLPTSVELLRCSFFGATSVQK